jgi:hypothetical protein
MYRNRLEKNISFLSAKLFTKIEKIVSTVCEKICYKKSNYKEYIEKITKLFKVRLLGSLKSSFNEGKGNLDHFLDKFFYNLGIIFYPKKPPLAPTVSCLFQHYPLSYIFGKGGIKWQKSI